MNRADPHHLVTAEEVAVPPDAIGFISIRAGIKFRGLVNVSGFHVDLGFKGQLKFAVYNAGSQTIRLDQGQPIFMIWFCDLDDPTKDLYRPRPAARNVITADDVSKIQGEVASPAELKKRIDELRAAYDHRILAIEKEQLIVRALLVAVIVAGIGILVKSLVAGGGNPSRPAASAAEERAVPEGGGAGARSTGDAPRRQPRQFLPDLNEIRDSRANASLFRPLSRVRTKCLGSQTLGSWAADPEDSRISPKLRCVGPVRDPV
jgi:hypothetical protein